MRGSFVSEAGRPDKVPAWNRRWMGNKVEWSQRASPLLCVGQRRQLTWSLWESVVSQDGTFYLVLCQRAAVCWEGLWRNPVFFSYLSRSVWREQSVTIYLFLLDTYIYVIYLFIWEYIFTVRSNIETVSIISRLRHCTLMSFILKTALPVIRCNVGNEYETC